MTSNMLTVAEVIRADKTRVAVSGPHRGKINKAKFPLRKTKVFPQSPDWCWWTIDFVAINRRFVCLVRLNQQTEVYSAILGFFDQEQLRVVCHHEHHTSHGGLHCHLAHGDVSDLPGVLRDKTRFRKRGWGAKSVKDQKSEITPVDAVAVALKRYRILDMTPVEGGLL